MEATIDPRSPKKRSISLSTLILVALGGGIFFGIGLNQFAPASVPGIDRYILDPIGQIFLRLVQFVVIPIVFSSLILGLTRIQDASQVGRYTLKLMTSYAITSAIAVALGMVTCSVLRPGAGITGLSLPTATTQVQSPSLLDWLISLVPVNPLEALSTGNLLQTIFSAALIGVGIQIAGEKANSFLAVVESVYAISEKILSIILYTAPIGVFALMSSIIATQGLAVIAKLLIYVLGLLFTTLLMIGVYVLALAILQAKPLHLLQSLFPALSLAFGTASSNAALPVALQNVQETYGLRPDIASFAIPLGTALKRDGAAILQGFNALFIAQIYHIPITSEMLLAIALSAFLVSFSTPGVPGSAIITMTTVLAAAGLPVEGVAIVAGVDRLTDGFKTVINVIGNVSNAVILSHWEKPKEESSVREAST
jgi:Na+/H+-dicarboxylate symporter